jgi:hypothetical protein
LSSSNRKSDKIVISTIRYQIVATRYHHDIIIYLKFAFWHVCCSFPNGKFFGTADFGSQGGHMNPGDTAFILVSAALVMLMTPGLALFYAGMARNKNVLATIMQNFICLGIVTIVWVLWGYSLSFGTDIGSIIGGFDFLGLKGVGVEPLENQTIPHLAFMVFQCMFAVITPALITGAFAERLKFSAFLIFVVLWVTLVYSPMCHWVWGGGWMAKMGALDFAGGAVVHMSSGASALAAVIVIGKRKGYPHEHFIPHNLPMTVLGAGLLWFGWFGFNAGSALASNGLGRQRVCGHAHSRGLRGGFVDRGGMAPPQTAHHPGRGLGRCGRTGGHHSGRRICRAHEFPGDRPGRGRHLLRRHHA